MKQPMSQSTMHVRRLVESAILNRFVVAVILVNAVLIGISTDLTDASALRAIAAIETVCVLVYLVEIVLRFIARDSTSAFFRDGWNIFDLVIVSAALVPASNGIGPVLRVLRVFRILTGDDWTQMRYELAQAGGSLGAFTAFQVSWIVVATFLLVNLIVGAVINNY